MAKQSEDEPIKIARQLVGSGPEVRQSSPKIAHHAGNLYVRDLEFRSRLRGSAS